MKYGIMVTLAIFAIILIIWKNKTKESAVIYTDKSGKETLDICQLTESAKFKLVANEVIPPEALKKHEEGRRFGSLGNYDLANECFRKASELMPTWAYPIYDMAYTLLL